MGVFDIFGTGDQQAAAAAQSAALTQANTQGQSDLTNGLNLATNSYTAGVAPFVTNLATTQPGQTAYANATGANGPAGNAAAIQNFQSSPGYQYSVNQADQNVMRNQAATGQLASGGTNVDLETVGQGLANNNYQQYVQNLLPFVGASTANAGGVLTGESGLGNLQNNNQTTAANMVYGTDTGIGNANASADLAGLSASSNLLGAGMNLAKLGVNAAAFL